MWPLPADRKRFSFPLSGLILFVFPFLVGCAALSARTAVVSTVIIEPVAGTEGAGPANFGLIGRVSVKDEKQGFSGGIHWHHTDTGDEILLLSPLGQAVAQIQRNTEGIRLTTSEQKVYYAADVEDLTKQVLGWHLPLMGLQYWVQSMNSPATIAAMDRDSDGRIVAIRQDDWEITYSSYFPPERLQTARPRVLVLNRGDLRIKLVIDQWKAD
ncbi:MAG: lipoprotein insertase outer membrane protein LolB [Pseudomonadota bacterium]|mgnify:FL=1